MNDIIKSFLTEKKQEEWNHQFKQYGLKVDAETALYFELEENFPSYLLTDGRRICFYKRNNTPFGDDGRTNWFDIEPQYVLMVEMRITDMQPRRTLKNDKEYCVIPLQENTFFDSIEDVNAYMHNLMFWESVLPATQAGPLMQRITWMVQKLYQMRGSIRDSVIMLQDSGVQNLSIDSDDVKQIIEKSMQSPEAFYKNLYKALEENLRNEKDYQYLLCYEIMRQMKDAKADMHEAVLRQEKMSRQVEDLQCQIREDSDLIKERKAKFSDIYVKIEDMLKDMKK